MIFKVKLIPILGNAMWYLTKDSIHLTHHNRVMKIDTVRGDCQSPFVIFVEASA